MGRTSRDQDNCPNYCKRMTFIRWQKMNRMHAPIFAFWSCPISRQADWSTHDIAKALGIYETNVCSWVLRFKYLWAR